MSSSPRNPTERDIADGVGRAAGWALVLALGAAGVFFGHASRWRPAPGEVRIYPELQLQLVAAPMPAIAAPVPVPVEETPLEAIPSPRPEPEPEVRPEPEPVSEPEVIPSPSEMAPAMASQAPAEREGDSGREDAIRAEWMAQLRQRIEQNKFYPGAARYSRESGTVLLRVEIGTTAEIGAVRVLENTGSALLREGALEILRRAAAQPLGTNPLPEGFQVDVPITYRIDPR